MSDSKEIKKLADNVGEMGTQVALMNQNLDRIIELAEVHQKELFGNGVKVGLVERMRGLEKKSKVILVGGTTILLGFLGTFGTWVFNNYFVK